MRKLEIEGSIAINRCIKIRLRITNKVLNNIYILVKEKCNIILEVFSLKIVKSHKIQF